MKWKIKAMFQTTNQKTISVDEYQLYNLASPLE
jgi:hypothetical protein